MDWNKLPNKMDNETLDWQHILADLKEKAYRNLINRWIGDRNFSTCLLTDLYDEALDIFPLFEMLQWRASQIIGMDISFSVVVNARANIDLRLKDFLIVADIIHPPFRTGSIDLIFSPSTLDHFDVVDPFINSLFSLNSVMKQGGRFLLTLDNPHNILDPVLRGSLFLRLSPFFVGKTYRRKEIKRYLNQTGWEVERLTTIIHHPRTFGVFIVKLAKWVNRPFFTESVRSMLNSLERFGDSRLRFKLGCFIAVLAFKENR